MNDPVFTKAVADFIQSRQAAGLANSTVKWYIRILDHLGANIQTWPPSIRDLEEYFAGEQKRIKLVSVNSVFSGIKAFFLWCEDRALIPHKRNPIRKIKLKKSRPLPKAAQLDDLRRFFALLEHNAQLCEGEAVRDYALFFLAFDTGCRASELCNLKLKDLDLDRGAIIVRHGKGDKDRTVFFCDQTGQILRNWLAVHPGGDWLFISRSHFKGGKLDRRSLFHSAKRWSDRAGVKLNVHMLRHTYATQALRQGIDLGHIQAQMGHSSIAVTQVYLKLEDESRRMAHRSKSPGNLLRELLIVS